MKALEHIKKKYNLSYGVPMPIILNRVGRHSEFKILLRELGYKTGAEIGTKEGRYAKELCTDLPDLKLYCIDPWKAYKNYQESWAEDQKIMDALYEQTKNRLSGLNCEIIRKTSIEAVKGFKDNTLDFVFIDGNHDYDFVLEDITNWTKVVKTGGIVFGHDFTKDHEGVMRAVRDYIKKNKVQPWFILHAGSNNADCWMFVKPERSRVIYNSNNLNI